MVSRVLACILLAATAFAQRPGSPDRQQIADAMKRATIFMVERVSTNGGYVWSYLPDLSRRWGELEARPTQIWIQPPGTATMGHLFVDAYHATKDEYYYHAAEKVAGALMSAQQSSGGWDYLADFAGERSLRDWYETIGRNAWRMEEFQEYWGNATFDDAGTAESAKFLLRLYVEKRAPKYKPALDKAVRFVLDSQYPIGAWPQRFPPRRSASGKDAGYTSYLTFNDDVAAENIDFLLMYYQTTGDRRVLDPIARGMNAFLVTHQAPPQPAWALQYTPDLRPAAARTYEPKALATHTTATNVRLLLKFYRLTGDTKFLARIPETVDWLEALTLPPGIATRGGTHPTFVELGTNKPLYVHRTGSNVVNGRYYVDHTATRTLGHYSAFRRMDVAGLRDEYARLKAMSAGDATTGSPLAADGGRVMPLARFFAVDTSVTLSPTDAIAGLTADGYWPAPLVYNSHPFRRRGSKDVAPGDFSQTHVGDETDTSPFPDDRLVGISTAAYIRNMSALIRALDGGRD